MTSDRFLRLSRAHMGEVAKNPEGCACPQLDQSLQELWWNALAAEALLLPAEDRKAGGFGSIPDTALPLGISAPTYGQLKARQVTVALFPIATSNHTLSVEPTLGLVWSVQGTDLEQATIPLDAPEELVSAAEEAGLRLYVEVPERVYGRSWQLAAALVIRAQENAVSPETRLALAADWLITGTVEHDAVSSIQFGNKMELASCARHRKWLYPAVDQHAFEGRSQEHNSNCEKHIPGQGVSTVSGAFQCVSGSGAHPELPMDWPQEVDVMHAFVGGFTPTVLVAALIRPPRELHLWHSKKTKSEAEEISFCLRAEVPRLQTQVVLHEIPTHDLTVMERELALFLKPVETPIYFNITSGNRLMMLAAACFAHQSKHIKMIYRDKDDPNLDYYQIYYDVSTPHTCVLSPTHLSPEQAQRYKEMLAKK